MQLTDKEKWLMKYANSLGLKGVAVLTDEVMREIEDRYFEHYGDEVQRAVEMADAVSMSRVTGFDETLTGESPGEGPGEIRARLERTVAALRGGESGELQAQLEELRAQLRDERQLHAKTVNQLKKTASELLIAQSRRQDLSPRYHPQLPLLARERTGWRRWVFGRWEYPSEPFRRDIQRRLAEELGGTTKQGAS